MWGELKFKISEMRVDRYVILIVLVLYENVVWRDTFDFTIHEEKNTTNKTSAECH